MTKYTLNNIIEMKDLKGIDEATLFSLSKVETIGKPFTYILERKNGEQKRVGLVKLNESQIQVVKEPYIYG